MLQSSTSSEMLFTACRNWLPRCFSPIARYNSVHLCLALVAQYGYYIHQMGVNTAYLNGVIDTKIYIKQPEYFLKQDSDSKVCLLRSLFMDWNKPEGIGMKSLIKSFLLWTYRYDSDSCVYVKRQTLVVLIVLIYVDDLLITDDLLIVKRKLLPSRNSCNRNFV